jgi:diguanylate cyclase (GGDEF)-like protein
MLAVLRTARGFATATDEQDVLRLAADAARGVLGYKACAIARRAPDGSFCYQYIAGLAADESRRLRELTLTADAFDALMAAATTIQGVRWVPPGHPVRERADVIAGTVPTDVSVEGETWERGSLLFVPMADASDRIVGFINPDDPLSGNLPDLSEALLLESLAEMTQVGLEAAQARSDAQRALAVAEAQRGQLEALLTASVEVRDRAALDEVLGGIAVAMTTAAGFRRAVIYLLEPSSQMLYVRADVGLPEADRKRMRETPVTRSEFAEMMRPEMQMSRSFLLDHRYFEVPAQLDEKLSIPAPDPNWVDGMWHAEDSLTVPLEDGDGSLLGIISVDEPVSGRLPALTDIHALELFADQCSLAVAQAKRYEQAVADAGTDPLTGLPNRRALDARAGQLVANAARAGRPCALVFMDLDHFKQVNDEFGHLTGDVVIAAVSRTLVERLRAGDLVARYGGEEFVAVLPGADLDGAVHVIEGVRSAVAALEVEGVGTTPLRISAGVTLVRPDEPLDRAFARADRALYQAKRGGRDRIEVSA